MALGYDPMWFGVIITIQIEVAAMTPPLGFNLFVLRRVVPDGDFRDIVAYAEQKGDHEDHGSRC